MFRLVLCLLQFLSVSGFQVLFLPIPSSTTIPSSSFFRGRPTTSIFTSTRLQGSSGDLSSATKNIYSANVKGGCVTNKSDHIRLLEQSLAISSGFGIFRRINDVLWEEEEEAEAASERPQKISALKNNITTPQQLDENDRFGILSHGIQQDPIYNYGNVASLKLFGYTLEELCHTPSRFSTVPSLMDDRRQLLQEIERVGYGTIRNGIRTSKQGTMFVMETIWVWNVYSDDGKRIGLAAMYDRERVKPYTGNQP